MQPGKFARCCVNIAIASCLMFLTSSAALARHKRHHSHGPAAYGSAAGGHTVPLPKPREGRITPAEGKALADYLLPPQTRIDEAFSALEGR